MVSRLFLFILFFNAYQAMPLMPYADNIAVLGFEEYFQFKGVVLDADTRNGLPLVSISLKNTDIGTVSNLNGEFVLKVPKAYISFDLSISHLGYLNKTIALKSLSAKEDNVIQLEPSTTKLNEVEVSNTSSAYDLVKQTLANRDHKYLSEPSLMTGFYREAIKRRQKNVSLSEAVVEIYKTPYSDVRKDKVGLLKHRKKTDYSKLDTLALKLQGGPFNTLLGDIIKYPDYIFKGNRLEDYNFALGDFLPFDDRKIRIVYFEQKQKIAEPLYKGKLFIDSEEKILIKAEYSLNITNKDEAARIFVKKKPLRVAVWPKEINYRVDYKSGNGMWHYSYSNISMTFVVNWKKKLFNSVYRLDAEMVVTDLEKDISSDLLRNMDKLKPTIVLSDRPTGFVDKAFWGEYNIIEPDKSIESAINKIRRQLERMKRKTGGGATVP